MTLGELLTKCKTTRRGTFVRVFAGCMTIYKGDPSCMTIQQWTKLHPYFNCKVANKGMVRNTFVITI